MVLKTSTKKVTVTVDVSALTYVVVSEETMSNPLVGTTFTDNGKVSYTLDFGYDSYSYDCTINLHFKSEAMCTLSWSDADSYDYYADPEVLIEEDDYPYTVEGNKITINATTKSNNKATIELTLSEDGTKLTFMNDVSGDTVKGQYLTKQ